MIPQPEECISPNQKAAPSGAAFACQKASQSSRPAGRESSSIHFSRRHVRREKYFARRECARMGLKDHSDARFGANDFLFQKSIALLEQD